jgi:hypothetical protein
MWEKTPFKRTKTPYGNAYSHELRHAVSGEPKQRQIGRSENAVIIFGLLFAFS